MYSYEIEEYLSERNYTLTPNEILEIINVSINTQIFYISYNSEYNYYEIRTRDGYTFKFGVKEYRKEEQYGRIYKCNITCK